LSNLARSIVEGEEPRGAAGRLLAGVLAGASGLYGAATGVRTWAYRAGVFPSCALPCPVVCVGNLTVGGTGKTPVAAAVAGLLKDLRFQPAIVSRGYGAKRAPGEIVVVSEGKGPVVAPDKAGDEPYLLARLLEGVPVVAGADRCAAGRTALERFGVSAIVLDDGFQHLRLRRDFNLVLLDASRDPRSMRLFPRGPLREGFGALRRASAIALTRADGSAHRDHWRAIAERWSGGAPVLEVRLAPTALIADCGRGGSIPLESLRGRRVAALCGIARPAAFRSSLEALGAEVRAERVFPDHHRYGPQDLQEAVSAARASGAEWVATTDKDAIKLLEFPSPGIPLYALRIAADFGPDRERLVELLRSRIPSLK